MLLKENTTIEQGVALNSWMLRIQPLGTHPWLILVATGAFFRRQGYMEWEKAVRMKDELVQMLMKYDWSFYLTGTFRDGKEKKNFFTVKRRFYRFLNQVRKECGANSTNFFFAIEPHRTGLYHIHVLLGNMVGVCKFCLWLKWFNEYGRCSISDYDPELGAGYYLTKYVTKGFCDWEMWLKKKGHAELVSQ
jgi:hypothetical protein